MEKTYTEIGIQLANIRIAIRIPRMKKPKLFRNKVKPAKAAESSEGEEGSWRDELLRKYSNIVLKTKSSSSLASSTESGFVEDDAAQWIRDFHTRYNPVTVKPDETQTVLSGQPAHTSTPLNLKIRPMNRLGVTSPPCNPADDIDVSVNNPDMSGVKIYDSLNYSDMNNKSTDLLCEKSANFSDKIYENLEQGIRDLLPPDLLLNNSYEIVSVENKVLGRAHFNPIKKTDYADYRTLERNYKTLEKDYFTLEKKYKTLERVYKPRTLKFSH